uniref:Carboxypeptidase n=1 Tax=Plectus sambesii TaxID=2011161 RepID=A0A914WU83_9BILA
MLTVISLFALSLSLFTTAQNASLDLIQNLPYLNYIPNFKQYSGYLKANANGTWKFHYWLVESQSNPETDPLILWLEGGPGCSSVGSFFEELGPFYANRDGQSLYENVFSWNKVANVLFIESPLGTGFSYDSRKPNNIEANDDLVANQNYMALMDFFLNVQPEYQNKPFYITGESYAGVYLPTLALNLVNGINNGSFPNKNFKGMAIGNGYMNEKHLTNSLILWSNYHARISTETWTNIKRACNCTGDVDDCNFYQYLTTENHLDCQSDNSTCGDLIVPLLTLPDNQDLYNYYEDCYDTNDSSQRYRKRRIPLPALKAYQDTAQKLDYDNTDNQFGFPCWNEDAAEKYLNKPEVQAALHIAKDWQDSVKTWQDCSDEIYDNYVVTYIDTSDLFRYIIGNVTTSDFRILIYSGDTDIVCNFLGVAWHIRDLAKSLAMPSTQHKPWFYRGQIAGHGQRYKGKVPIDLLTVKVYYFVFVLFFSSNASQ